MRRVGNLFHHKLIDMHLDLFFIFIENNFHIVFAFRIITAESGKHSLFDLLIHVFSGNTFFFFDVFNRFKKFCVH